MFRRRQSQPKPAQTEAPNGGFVEAAWEPAAPNLATATATTATPLTAGDLDGVEPHPIPDPEAAEDLAEPAAGTTQAAEILMDERLVKNAQRGELVSFNTLVTRHERAVFNVCLRLLRDAASAEDASQDTFVKAWTSLDQFRGGLFRPWLLRIASNRCYDILRARGRRPADSLDAKPYEIEPEWTSQSSQAEHPENFATRRELSFHLERALATLPEDQRLAVILADVQGYGYEEVAAITGVALGTVKSRISRARARLRQMLRDDPTTGELFERYGRLTRD
jgi:RNA polymerase sigma-70 factor (ECF subfamily)